MRDRNYEVSRVGTEAELTELRDEWGALVAEIPDAHLFHLWEWLTTWWRHHREDGDLWLLMARETGNGKLTGILPLVRVPRRFGPLRVRMLTYLFYRPPIHQTIIAPPSERRGVTQAFVNYLTENPKAWEVLSLDGFLADEALIEGLRSARGQYYEREAPPCHVIRLPESWEAYEKNHLSANRRQQLRRARRKLESDYPGQVVFERLTEPHEVQAVLETLVDLNRHRWHEEGIRSAFDEARFVEFHREMAPCALEAGWLRFYRLTVAGENAALRYCFRFRDLLYDYQLTFNLNLAEYRPGELLLAHVLPEAMREGVREFDMLRGTYRYKRSWATDTRYEKSLVASANWRGHAWVTGIRLVDWAKVHGKNVLPGGLRRRLNRLASAAKYYMIQTTNDGQGRGRDSVDE